MTFESYEVTWPLTHFSTALTEIFDTLSWMGGDARQVLPTLEALLVDFSERFGPTSRTALIKCVEEIRASSKTEPCCCGSPLDVETNIDNRSRDLELAEIVVEDQDGQSMRWGDYFHGQPSLVAFFYATCQNPRRCVQTIYNLVEIRHRLIKVGMEGSVRTVAITYEPDRDTAEILKQYGKSKKATFDANFKFLRTPQNFPKVIENFRLGVNYVGTQVNDHQIELYVLDRFGDIAGQYVRQQAKPESVVAHLLEIAADQSEH